MKTDTAELRALRVRLKSGEYDGTDIMRAWLAIDRLLDELERECVWTAHNKNRLNDTTYWNTGCGIQTRQTLSGISRCCWCGGKVRVGEGK